MYLDREELNSRSKNHLCDFSLADGHAYPGYAVAVNELIAEAMTVDPSAEWFVAAGDDIEPDLNHSAEEIAGELASHFCMLHGGTVFLENVGDGETLRIAGYPATFGVMQPTGDRWGDDAVSRARYGEDRGAYIDRVCGSAWIGREFAKRAYGGKGPLWPEYTHMYVDEELQEVSTKLGVLWQRRDLIQLHKHWGREADGKPGDLKKMPEFLRKANEEMGKFKRVFEARKRAGFPGHEPL